MLISMRKWDWIQTLMSWICNSSFEKNINRSIYGACWPMSIADSVSFKFSKWFYLTHTHTHKSRNCLRKNYISDLHKHLDAGIYMCMHGHTHTLELIVNIPIASQHILASHFFCQLTSIWEILPLCQVKYEQMECETNKKENKKKQYYISPFYTPKSTIIFTIFVVVNKYALNH